jgi:hypothetical protein
MMAAAMIATTQNRANNGTLNDIANAIPILALAIRNCRTVG